jgi:O-antigen ligase
MSPGGVGPLDRGACLVARAAILGALASPVLVLDGAYFPYTVARAAAFDRCADLALIAWLFLLARGALVPRATPTSLLLLAFAGWILVTALTGAHPERSFGSTLERGEGALSWARAALLLLVADGVFVGAKQRRTLLAGATGAAIAVLIAAVAATPDPSMPLRGAFGNSGLLAGYLLGALALPLILAGDRAAGAALRIAAGAAACALLLGLMLTGNRATAIALAAGVAAAGATRLRHRATALAGIVLAVGVVAILLVADDPRGVAWDAALRAITERPLLGWGVENFNLPFDRYRVGAEAEAFFDRAHNALLDWAVAGGLVAAALHLAPMLRGLSRAGDTAAPPPPSRPARSAPARSWPSSPSAPSGSISR